MSQIACIVIAGGKRETLIDGQILPSIRDQGFDEVLVVGEHHEGDGYRYLHVPKLLGTTTDALIKRDCGSLAAVSDILVYLCDDHSLLPGFCEAIRQAPEQGWDVLVPKRFADHPEHGRIRINNGESEGYCGGHSGVFRRWVIEKRPWTAMPHHRLWDLLASQIQLDLGFTFICNAPLGILDCEPHACPWN